MSAIQQPATEPASGWEHQAAHKILTRLAELRCTDGFDAFATASRRRIEEIDEIARIIREERGE